MAISVAAAHPGELIAVAIAPIPHRMEKLLKANAHTPVEDLAKGLNLTEADVRRSIAEYEREGHIRACYATNLDQIKLDMARIAQLVEERATEQRTRHLRQPSLSPAESVA